MIPDCRGIQFAPPEEESSAGAWCLYREPKGNLLPPNSVRPMSKDGGWWLQAIL